MARTEGAPNRAGKHEEFSIASAPPMQFPQEQIKAHRVREGLPFTDSEFAKVDTACWRSENVLGRNIACAREGAGYTQTALANALGISARTLKRYEHGEVAPDVETLRIIALITGTPTDWLLGLVDDGLRELMDYYEFGTPTQRASIVRLARIVQDGREPQTAAMAERDKDEFLARLSGRVDEARQRCQT